MNRKMYWGIGALILLIGIVGLYFILQPDPEPITVYKVPSDEVIKQTQQSQQPAAEGDRQPPPGASPNGHWHDGEWHDEPHQMSVAQPPTVSKSSRYRILGNLKQESAVLPIPAGVGRDWASMTDDEVAAAIRAIELRQEHAPDGYVYEKRESHQKHIVLWLDENGYPILKKRGDPSFTINWITGFRPTPEQYAEYKVLAAQYAEIRAQTTSSPELDRLSAELRKFRETHTGEVPHAIGYSYSIPGHIDKDAYLLRARRISSQIRVDAYRKAGLGYMLDYIQP